MTAALAGPDRSWLGADQIGAMPAGWTWECEWMPESAAEMGGETRVANAFVRQRPPPAIPQASTPGGALKGVLRRYRWRMIAVAMLVIAGSALVYPRIPKRYQAYAQIVLRPAGQEGTIDFSREARNSLDESAIDSEIEVLSSPGLAGELAKRLHLAEDPEFNPSLRPAGKLAGIKRAATSALEALGLMPELDPMQSGTSLKARKNRIVERELSTHLDVKRDRRSYVLRVGFWSGDADKAANLANTLTTSYLRSQLERKRAALSTVTDWLAQRVADLEHKHDSSQQAVYAYLTASGLADASIQTSLQQQLATLSSEVALARSGTVAMQVRARSLLELQRGGTLDSAPEVLASSVVQRLRERLVTLNAGVGSISGSGPGGALQPAVNELRQAIDAEAGRIVRGAQAEAASGLLRESQLRAEIARISADLTARQVAERRLDTLRREERTNRSALDEARTRQRAEAGKSDILQPDADILARAEAPLRPAFPNALLAAFGTLALAVVAALASVLPALLRLRWRTAA